jgi:hypothetical protein
VWRELIRRDFDIDLPISGGNGNSLAERIILETESPFSASRIEFELIKCIFDRLNYFWRIVEKTAIDGLQSRVEKVGLEIQFAEAEQVVTERRSFYFDISRLTDESLRSTPAGGFSLGASVGFGMPFEIGWLHFQRSFDNEAQAPGMGLTLAYGAPHIKATLYVYNKQQGLIDGFHDPKQLDDEFNIAVKDMITANPSAKLLSERSDLNLRSNSYDIEESYAVIMLTTRRNQYLKVRATISYTNDEHVFRCLWDSLSIIASWSTR